MNQRQWLQLSLFISLILLGTTISMEKLYLNRPFKWAPTLKLPYAPQSAADSASFWEATINGNARKISKDTKEKLKALGLAHIYTPSGLHLSLILGPLLFFVKSKIVRGILLSGFFLLTFLYLPGWPAVKRVFELKLFQIVASPLGLGSRSSFLIVMFFDLAFGTYHEGALSFCFSFLFLSLLYASMNFLVGAWWFFIAQLIIALFLEQQIFITNIIITPILTLIFSALFPILIVIRVIPPWHHIGEKISGLFLKLVDMSFDFSSIFPKLEVTIFILMLVGFILFHKKKCLTLGIILCSGLLNTDENKYQPSYFQRKYFYLEVNEGKILKKCKLEGGFEKCSYRRSRST